MAKQDQDVPGRAQELAEAARSGSLGIVTPAQEVSVPQAPGSWAQAGRVPPVLVRDALRAAEMLGKEMQLVGGGLVRQLVQPLLGGRGRLQGRTDTVTKVRRWVGAWQAANPPGKYASSLLVDWKN